YRRNSRLAPCNAKSVCIDLIELSSKSIQVKICGINIFEVSIVPLHVVLNAYNFIKVFYRNCYFNGITCTAGFIGKDQSEKPLSGYVHFSGSSDQWYFYRCTAYIL